MNCRLLAAAVVALVPLVGIASPGDPKSDNKSMSKATADQAVSFDALDANKDGRISMPEASADPRLVEAFSTADKNGDGYLDNAEFQSIPKQPKQ
jgi:Ca2+-binding EF-hand superfamily protein